MIALIRLWAILAILVADVKTGASQDKDIKPMRCYSCGGVNSNKTDCQLVDNLSPVNCTSDSPYCGTTAKSPDYVSSLSCSVGSQTPCTLIQTAEGTYEMTCTCDDHLCNKPFTREFRNELLNFSTTNLATNTTVGLADVFIKSTEFANATSAKLYEAITQTMMTQEMANLTAAPPTVISSSTSSPNVFKDANAPRAEALKQEATVPSDDDEDEGEGSGSFEDVKPQAPAAPAAPSSFLPANENAASSVNIDLYAMITFISLYAVA